MTGEPRRQELLIVEVTARCNLRCLHCYNVWAGPRPYPVGELPTAQMVRLLERALDQSGATEVTLTGGEPLLRPDLPELVSWLQGRGVGVGLISNGTRLTEEALARFPVTAVGIYELPLLSSEEAVFDRMTGQPGTFAQVTEAMALLKLAGARVVGVFVATRLNLPTLEETLELAVALGLDGVMLNRFNPGGRGLANLELLQAGAEELGRALDVASRFSEAYQLPVTCSIPMPPCLFDHGRWPGLGFGHCSAGTERAYFTLDPAGNLRPCNHSPLVLGNLLSDDFWPLLDGPAMAGFMAARPAVCRGCAVEDRCLGGCKASAEQACGDPCAPDPFLAAHLERLRCSGPPRS